MDPMVCDTGANADFGSLSSSRWEFRWNFMNKIVTFGGCMLIGSFFCLPSMLQPDKVKRQMSILDGKLLVHFEAVEARFLRASFSAFVYLSILTTPIIEENSQQNNIPMTIVMAISSIKICW
ncbi:hypothetical protein C4D60_Mb11t13560 [Musa balbisiana]|uniref:Uncharacterized protein n=1 Tax=Musa balbisiana TaxID=52838 RepID=A0A4V4H5H9_MUSBA|nr:hypothetical protein C4D60_Mb11t13560 [Musa balbisiana]